MIDPLTSFDSAGPAFYRALSRIAAVTGPGRAVRRGLENALVILVETLGYRRACLELHDLPQEGARIILSHGKDQGLDHLYGPAPLSTGQVIGSGRSLVLQDIKDHPDFLGRPPEELTSLSYICVPVSVPEPDGQVEGFEPVSRTGVIGALSVDLPKAPMVFLEAQREFLTVVGAVIGNGALRLRDELDRSRRRPSVVPQALETKPETGEAPAASEIITPVAASKSMRLVLRQIAQAADAGDPVLLRGEEGTGKETLARYLHAQGDRRHRPFVRLACGDKPAEAVLEALFGVQKGERSKATRSRRGIFELAGGGIVFLDDIDELPVSAQKQVLRIIQEGFVERLGGEAPVPVDARVVAATRTSLEDALARGEFLEDLYYALGVFSIFVPPLRERTGDILPLAECFLEEFSRRTGNSVRRISTPAIDLLNQYHWPGNVRELAHCMERAATLCDEAVLRTYHLPPTLQTGESSGTEPSLSFGEAVADFETELLVEALKKAKGNMYQAARNLRESYRVVNYKVKKYGIDPKRFTPGRHG
ncbi:transcriptional regulator, NifA subfamily, Fis Family [Solidesulfovibrio fructosivorans JJ]]|uniref:Transcriptional regulator, NifA subfamily, Fis Family n=1 Tax=Solidesulfovibrio fructosivorans JJ] TaxID=596151 RepID=E1JW16_SOLFR|nr:sigma 54-interacting transcriptional regulator [Solidesulfovibrio fructosivorans]EFL51376.1 transcriptional regulator, NifA subfamily, Fis Family [Solidesulfovibrio fructosivorans JJ]]